MHGRRRHTEEPLHVRFGRWYSVDQGVRVDERKILALQEREHGAQCVLMWDSGGVKARADLPARDATTRLIDGFGSPLGMELLAAAYWLLQEQECEPTVSVIVSLCGTTKRVARRRLSASRVAP